MISCVIVSGDIITSVMIEHVIVPCNIISTAIISHVIVTCVIISTVMIALSIVSKAYDRTGCGIVTTGCRRLAETGGPTQRDPLLGG